MMKDKLTMVIHSCDKFSDLWDVHVKLLNRNWPKRNIKTLLVTDKKSYIEYNNIQIISAGEGTELSERTEVALRYINTEYILITLDDYFPIYRISSKKIEQIMYEMEKYKLDYVRLFKRPNSKKKIPESENLYYIDLWDKKDFNYQVNLYVGIWKKSFLEETIKGPLDAWNYELSLSKIAREVNAKCAMSKGREFETLDVVRKGEILHKANRYLKRHNLYHGSRNVISWKAEWRINIFTFIKDKTPQVIVNWGKGILRKRGQHFYSDKM